jgi:hypothetical protein
MTRIIYTNNEGGVSVIIPSGELSIEEIAAKDVPEGVAFEIVEDSVIPSDRFFRNAWTKGNGKINVDLEKAKAIGHDIRRTKRAEEFTPHDEVIAKQIPGKDAAAAEAARAGIRAKYDAMQAAIDAAGSPEEIKAALEGNEPLPAEGTEPPEETVLIRARNEDGTFIADDPSTPENEAYVEVPISEA